jgi:hypothetical protein
VECRKVRRAEWEDRAHALSPSRAFSTANIYGCVCWTKSSRDLHTNVDQQLDVAFHALRE